MSVKQTKAGNLGPVFMQAARQMEEESLAYLFVNAFGITLDAIVAICLKMVETGDHKVAQLCLTAAVQIRNHVVYVGSSYGDVRTKYPELIIEGNRTVPDIFNFSALHICGMALSHFTGNQFGKKVLAKAGDCILGSSFPESEAGKINKEIADSWTPEEKTMFLSTKANIPAELKVWLDAFFANITVKSTSFAAVINPTQAALQTRQALGTPMAAIPVANQAPGAGASRTGRPAQPPPSSGAP